MKIEDEEGSNVEETKSSLRKRLNKLQNTMQDSTKSRKAYSPPDKVLITKNPCVFVGDIQEVNVLTEKSDPGQKQATSGYDNLTKPAIV